MRKSIAILMLFIFSLTMAAAQEVPADPTTTNAVTPEAAPAANDSSKKEEEVKEFKFPGKFGLEFSQRFDAEAFDNLTRAAVRENYIRTAEGADLYLRNELKLSLGFELGKLKDNNGKEFTFYTLTPWVKDRFDIRMNDVYDVTRIPTALNPSKFQFIPRNRFYVGLDNTFKIPEAINIGLNFEARIGYDDAQKISGTVDHPDANYAPYVDVKLSPMIDLSGSYKFGFSWRLYQSFNIYLYPVMERESLNEVYNSLEFEGIYRLAYDFLSPLKQKNLKGEIFIEDTFFASIYADQYVIAKTNYRKADMYSDMVVGFNFNLFGITPMFGLYHKNYYAMVTNDGNALTKDSTDANKLARLYTRYDGASAWAGVKVGLGYTKDWFSISVNYIGRYNTISNGLDVFKAENSILKDNIRWENHIDATVKFKI